MRSGTDALGTRPATRRTWLPPFREMVMATRRRFLKLTAAGGAAAYLSPRFGLWSRAAAQIPGGTLRPDVIPKFVTPLVIPPAMPATASGPTIDRYSIAVRQFAQRILPAPHRPTPVWGYGSTTDAATFNYPSFTIEATANKHTEVTWLNQLVDSRGNYLPHLLPVDQTLHWAHPPGGLAGRDMHGDDPTPYRGPVPIVTHLHGGRTTDESDGYPEAWYLPVAANIPPGFATTGTWYRFLSRQIRRSLGRRLGAGHRDVQVHQRPACRDALVSRSHARHDATQRLCGSSRLLSDPRGR